MNSYYIEEWRAINCYGTIWQITFTLPTRHLVVTLVIYKLFASLLIFFASLVSVLYPLRSKNTTRAVESFEIAEAFASGVFLGVAFFHMLPNAIHSFQTLYGSTAYPFAELICISAFLFLIFLERLSYLKNIFNPRIAIPYLMALILIIHSLIEGIALGVENIYTEAFIIFLAVFTHKGCDSFALCIVLLRYALPMRQIFSIIFLFSLITPLGIGLGTLLTTSTPSASNENLAAIFNAFAAGSFLYIATLHHVHFHHHDQDENTPLIKFLSLFLGTAVMAIIAVWV